MKLFTSLIFLLLGAVVAFSCSPAKLSPQLFGETVPPNHCRVTATVLSIDPNVQSSKADDPCAKAPCGASLRIDEVIGYGSAFSSPLAAGDVVEVHFAFSTGPTKTILPELSRPFPGVEKGTRLTADLQGEITRRGSEEEKKKFTIFGYQVR